MSLPHLHTVLVVGAILPVVVVIVLVLNWHHDSESRLVPYHDGSHHVANVASLVAGTRTNGLGYFLDFADRSPSDALTYGFFGLVSSVVGVGVGRFAFGVVWTICLAVILIALGLHFRAAQGAALIGALAMLLFAGLFQTDLGGARDTRVDLLATTLSAVALLLLVSRRVFAACLVALAASFAKGAAVSLLVPLFLSGLVIGFVPVRKLFHPTPSLLAKAVLILWLGWVFATRIGPQTVSYNLMATGGSTLQDRVRLFVENAWNYLERDPWFYSTDLYDHYHGWLVSLVVILLAVGIIRRWPVDQLRIGGFSLLATAYTWLLMTISPLHANVLTVWFLPAMVLGAVFASSALARVFPAIGVVGAAAVVLVPTLLPLRTPPIAPQGPYAEPAAELFGQAFEIAGFLDSEFAGRSTRAVLLVNFLSSNPPIFYNYDVFRVLIQEHLRRATINLDGWELGSFGTNWRTELYAQKAYPEILFVIQQNPHGIEAGNAVRDFISVFRTDHPECVTEIARPIRTIDDGRQDALRLNPTDACRQALFAEPA